jgi:hypothetical protein
MKKKKQSQNVEGQSREDRATYHVTSQAVISAYFSDSPVYTDELFCWQFRMHRSLFLRIVHDIEAHDRYFAQKKDAVGKPGLHPFQKITLAIRMLAYGGSANANDEYLRISESTALESLNRFCTATIEV